METITTQPYAEKKTVAARAYYREWYYGIRLTGSVIAAWIIGTIVALVFGWMGFGSGVTYYATLVSSLAVLGFGIVSMVNDFKPFIKDDTFDVKSNEFAVNFSTVAGSIVYKIMAVAGKSGIEWRGILHEGKYHFWRNAWFKEEQRHFKKSRIIISVTRSNEEALLPEWHCELKNFVFGYEDVKEEGSEKIKAGDPILSDIKVALSLSINTECVTANEVHLIRSQMVPYWRQLLYSRNPDGKVMSDSETRVERTKVNEWVKSMAMDFLEAEIFNAKRPTGFNSIEEAKVESAEISNNVKQKLEEDIISKQLKLPNGSKLIEVELVLTFNYVEGVIKQNVLQEEQKALNDTEMVAKQLELKKNQVDNEITIKTSEAKLTESLNKATGDEALLKASVAYLKDLSEDQLRVLVAEKILPKDLQTLIINSGSGGNGNGADPGMVAAILGIAKEMLDKKGKPKPEPVSDAA